MKRPTRKLIAFSTALLSLMNLVVPVAQAGYKSEMIEGCDIDELMEMRDKGILIKNGYDYSMAGDTEIIVIDSNGEKHVVSKDEGITGIYSYVTTTMGQYNFISMTADPYSFDYHNQSYRISTEGGEGVIVGVGDKFAIMNDKGKVVSKTYNAIYRINDRFFNVDEADDPMTNISQHKVGLIDATGKEIIPVTEGVIGYFACGDNIIQKTEDGYCIIDENGKRLSPVYKNITSAGVGYRGDLGFSQIYGEDRKYQLDYNNNITIFEVTQDENSSCLYNCDTEEYSPFYETVSSFPLRSSQPELVYFCQKDGKYTIYDNDMKVLVSNASRISQSYVDDEIIDGSRYSIYDLYVDKDGVTTVYNYKLDVIKTFPTHDEYYDIGCGIVTIDGTEVNVWDNEYKKSSKVNIDHEISNAVINSVEFNKYEYVADFELDVNYTYTAYSYSTGDGYHYTTGNGYDWDYTTGNGYDWNYTTDDSYDWGYTTYDPYVTEYTCTTDSHYKFIVDSDFVAHDVSGYANVDKIGKDAVVLHKTSDSPLEYVNFKTGEKKDFIGNYTIFDAACAPKKDYYDPDVIVAYYLVNDDSFIVCDTDLNPLTDSIKGRPVTHYETENVFELDGKYGVFSLTDGVTAPAVYDKLEKGYGGFLATVGEKKFIIDNKGAMLKELDSAYTFVAPTRAPYDVNWNLTKRVDGVLSTMVYNFDDKDVKFEQTGKYDYVSYFEKGYAVVSINETSNEDEDEWSEGKQKYGLVYIDGTEVIKPDNCLYLYIYPVNDDEVNLSMSVYLENEKNVRTKSSFDMNIKDMNFDLAAKNDLLLAFKNSAGNYLVVKDYLWGMYSDKGSELIKPSFCYIANPINGLYLVRTPKVYEGELYCYAENGEKVKYDNYTVAETGVIDIDGRIVVKPFSNVSDGMEVEQVRNSYCTSPYLKTVQVDKYGANICTVDEKGFSRFTTIKYSDVSNDFAVKYGYDVARKEGDLYYVEKDGLAGIVSEQNEVLVPIEYRDVLSFNLSSSSLRDTRYSLRDEMQKDEYSSKLNYVGDGKYIVYVQDNDRKVGVYMLTNENTRIFGDINGDNVVNSSDASAILAEYASVSTGGQSSLTPEQFAAADVNSDGAVNSADASLVLSFYSYASTGGKETDMKAWIELNKKEKKS